MAGYIEHCSAHTIIGLRPGQKLTFMEHPMRDRITVAALSNGTCVELDISKDAWEFIKSWAMNLECEAPEPVEESFRKADRQLAERILVPQSRDDGHTSDDVPF